jgi:hypothetical protein
MEFSSKAPVMIPSFPFNKFSGMICSFDLVKYCVKIRKKIRFGDMGVVH